MNQNFHQVICSKDGGICGHLDKYCDTCPMKPVTTTFNISGSNYENQVWQKCPICFGTGILQQGGTYNTVPTCPTCNGKRIISTLTGNAPQ